MFRIAAFASIFACLFSLVVADGLQVLSPGGPDLWWVAQSVNTLAWSCNAATSTQQTFTVLIANNQTMAAPLAIIAVENNFDCSKTITQEQSNQAPGTGYTIQLANPLNNTDIYAESLPFEIKPLGSTYPTTTVAGQTATASGGSSSSTSGAASPTKSNAASLVDAPSAFGMAAVAFLGAIYA